MATNQIEAEVEALSEAVVFVEPGDLNELASLHSRLQSVGVWANNSARARAAAATAAACTLIEQIILDEHDNPARAIEIVANTVSALQRIVRDGLEDAQVDYPPELGLARPRPVQSPANGGPVPAILPERPFRLELPAYVDQGIFAEFLARQDTVLEEIETALLAIEHGPDPQAQGLIARHLHTLKGETALLGLAEIEQLCHAAEDLLDRGTFSEVAERLLALKDWLKSAFDVYAGKGGSPPSSHQIFELLKAPSESRPAPAPITRNSLAVHAENAADPYTPAQQPDRLQSPRQDMALLEATRELTGDKDLIADFIAEAGEHLENCDVQLLTLEVDPLNQPAIDAVFRAFHTIKGVCGFIDLQEMQALAHESENLLDQARKGDIVLEGPYLDIVFDAIDMLKKLLSHVRSALEENAPLRLSPDLPPLIRAIADLAAGRATSRDGAASPAIEEADLISTLAAEGPTASLGEILLRMGALSPEILDEALARQRELLAPEESGNGSAEPERKRAPIGEVLVQECDVEARTVAHALRTQKQLRQMAVNATASRPSPPEVPTPALRETGVAAAAPAPAPGSESGAIAMRDTVKVDAGRLDQLVDMIGELVIAESMVCQSRELRNNLSTELSRYVSQLDKITRELQEMATGLRMVPIRSTFQKMARLVRDVAKKTGKEVDFSMQGEETELDKTVVDRISDPLVHMIRNAVDHGLEDSGSARRAAGKPTAGRISLRAYHSGGNIQIEIADDGRGLDREAILRKARERALVTDHGESLTNKEVWKLIFEPGFSTAKQLTELSGRGVGMDVVRRNIEELRGEIDIDSEAGVGSRFTIRLPLTLAIIDGMVVRVAGERYIIPTLSIVVSVRPRPGDLGTVVGVGETLRLHGGIIPLFRLYKLFGLRNAVTAPTEGTVVVLENAGRRVGLLIDEILGQQQIVIKSLGASLRGVKGIAGGAIMPDGRVGLIIDIGELVRLATDGVPA